MKKFWEKINKSLVFILFLAALTRFLRLRWGFPFAFHPDEFNMAIAITRLDWPKTLNPHFFAYGQFPLYLAYFSILVKNLFLNTKAEGATLLQAIFWLRLYSALAGIGSVYLVYLITKKLFSTEKVCFLTALLAVFTPGLIQIAHFGTTESLLGFFFLATIYLSMLIIEKQKVIYFFWLILILGLSLGTKITALVFFAPIVFSFFASKSKKYFWFLFLIPFLTFLVSPYLVLSFKESLGTLTYETAVATGKTKVFYTRQFIDTQPIIFQLTKVFPYALGWPIYLLGILGMVLGTLNQLKKKTFWSLKNNYFLLLVCFGLYFLSQAFLFTKWARFMAPIFAFFPIFVGHSLFLLKRSKVLIIALAIFPGLLFLSIYLSLDIRIKASNWIGQNIPSQAKILSESGNMVDIGIGQFWPNFTSFDFYYLDEDPQAFSKLLDLLETNDYLFIPSRRMFANHLRLPGGFPKTSKYYQLLFQGKLGFVEIQKITPFYSVIFNDEKAEETFTVFDHPTIRIYKKAYTLTRLDYEKLFEN